MSVLVDSSVWIDYFRGTGDTDTLDLLIEENLIVTNDLILSELIPALSLRNQNEIISLLRELRKQEMVVSWNEIILLQTTFLRAGINGIGIPDIMIAQNAIQGGLRLLSMDNHFKLISQHTNLELFK